MILMSDFAICLCALRDDQLSTKIGGNNKKPRWLAPAGLFRVRETQGAISA